MADDKKPKIDLKARLGKMGGQTPAPPPPAPSESSRPAPGSVPAPALGSNPSSPSPGPRGVPAPPGIPVGPPSPFASQPAPIDPSNPLAAVAQPGGYRPQPTPQAVAAAPPQPQRIEVDESAVQEARASARKQGIVIAGVAAVIFAGVGWVGGGASAQSEARRKSVADAQELAGDVGKAKASLQTLVDKLEAGREQIKKREFPATLAADLGGVNVDFDGMKLAGRRFSGFPTATTQQLVEMITSVQAVNDRKGVIVALLNKLQKPLTEQLKTPAGQQTVTHVVVVDKDPSGNPAAFLANLAAPILLTKEKIDLPAEFTFGKPGGGGNATAPRYKGGDAAAKAAALYVVPKTFDAACPSETAGQLAQLSAQIGNFARDIKGEGAAAEGLEAKPGLIERADRLQQALQKVQ